MFKCNNLHHEQKIISQIFQLYKISMGLIVQL